MYEKQKAEIELHDDQRRWLEDVANEYDLPDIGKVIRVLIDHATMSGDKEEIFETIRCRRC